MKMFTVRQILIWAGLLKKEKCTWTVGGKRKIVYYYTWNVNPYEMFNRKDKK